MAETQRGGDERSDILVRAHVVDEDAELSPDLIHRNSQVIRETLMRDAPIAVHVSTTENDTDQKGSDKGVTRRSALLRAVSSGWQPMHT